MKRIVANCLLVGLGVGSTAYRARLKRTGVRRFRGGMHLSGTLTSLLRRDRSIA
jgi:hypothetical protein